MAIYGYIRPHMAIYMIIYIYIYKNIRASAVILSRQLVLRYPSAANETGLLLLNVTASRWDFVFLLSLIVKMNTQLSKYTSRVDEPRLFAMCKQYQQHIHSRTNFKFRHLFVEFVAILMLSSVQGLETILVTKHTHRQHSMQTWGTWRSSSATWINARYVGIN